MLLVVHLFNLFFEVMQVVEYSILLSAQYSKSDNFTKLHFIGILVKMCFLWMKIFKFMEPLIKTSNGKVLIWKEKRNQSTALNVGLVHKNILKCVFLCMFAQCT